MTSDTRREEYRRRQEERKRDYRKRIRSQNSSSYSSCLNTPQKREIKVKICRLIRKKDKELSILASQLATSTPISLKERGDYSSESEDESGKKVDFLVSNQLWKCLSHGSKRREKAAAKAEEISKVVCFCHAESHRDQSVK